MRRSFLALVAALILSGLVTSVVALGGPSSRATVKVAYNKTLKKAILVDGRGRTLYLFTQDTAGKATCAAADPECPKLWPAFASVGKPLAGKGVNVSLIGTTRGAHGVNQVTYNHHPLYYFAGLIPSAGDRKPGDVKGQAFYGVWYVVSPKGNAIRTQ